MMNEAEIETPVESIEDKVNISVKVVEKEAENVINKEGIKTSPECAGDKLSIGEVIEKEPEGGMRKREIEPSLQSSEGKFQVINEVFVKESEDGNKNSSRKRRKRKRKVSSGAKKRRRKRGKRKGEQHSRGEECAGDKVSIGEVTEKESEHDIRKEDIEPFLGSSEQKMKVADNFIGKESKDGMKKRTRKCGKRKREQYGRVEECGEDKLSDGDHIKKEVEHGIREKEIKPSAVLSEEKLPFINQVIKKESEDCVKEPRKKLTRRQQSRAEKCCDEMLSETSYFFKDGLRFVFPYHFELKSKLKDIYVNMTLLDVLCKQFRRETIDYYRKAIETGKVKVNDQVASSDRVMKIGDTVTRIVHRHEPPVLHETIEFLQIDDDLVVINKPSSIPVSPSGRYRHNSIIFILGNEFNLTGLTPQHKMNRLVSGLFILAKNESKAKPFKKLLECRYFARVVGKFPSDEITVNEPVLMTSSELAVGLVHPDGRPSSTKFKLIKYNGKSSLVSCKLKTNRMHQVRVHLQHLGHPIINDPIYNHPTAWVKCKGSYNIDEVLKEIDRTKGDRTYDQWLETDELDSKGIQTKSDPITKENVACYKKRKLEVGIDSECSNGAIENEEERTYYNSYISDQYLDEDCTDCKRKWKQPLVSELVMYLHLFYCKVSDFKYETSIPNWAREEWNFS